ncbi:MAG TPA: ABC transporter ATP-binding protein [Nocardioidaceae bacterium]|nr:ABC transporter ATP-binding protein [Nocardioidaceae bacterium]
MSVVEIGEPVVRAHELTKVYGDLRAVDRVSIKVQQGDVYGLLGPNGAGKTTFMRMLFGLIRPDSGDTHLWGIPVQPDPVAALSGVAGFVETPRFYPYLSGRANLELLARLDGDGSRARIDEALDVVQLADRARDRVRGYSYGMVQRLGVAAALLRDPSLLVLDEPTNGLDPAGIRDMRELVRRLAGEGITILLSSHNMSEVDEICTKVAIMRRGRVAFVGPMHELRGRADRATRHLDTTNNQEALSLVSGRPGVSRPQLEGGLVTFDADDRTVEQLSRELVTAGLAIRTLTAPTTALETLFFTLTEADQQEDAA